MDSDMRGFIVLHIFDRQHQTRRMPRPRRRAAHFETRAHAIHRLALFGGQQPGKVFGMLFDDVGAAGHGGLPIRIRRRSPSGEGGTRRRDCPLACRSIDRGNRPRRIPGRGIRYSGQRFAIFRRPSYDSASICHSRPSFCLDVGCNNLL